MGWEILNVPQDLREVLEKDEKILWVAKPRRAAFVLKSAGSLIIALPFLLMPIFLFGMAGPAITHPFVILFLVFWYGAISLMAFAPLYSLLVWKNVWYVLTDKRVIVRKGLIGIDYDFLELENIQQVNVDVGLWDKVYGTGSIVLQAIGVSPVTLSTVEEPYKAQKEIRKAVEEARSVKSAF